MFVLSLATDLENCGFRKSTEVCREHASGGGIKRGARAQTVGRVLVARPKGKNDIAR